MRTIAVDLDDTLNNFTQTLRATDFAYHDRYALSPAVFDEYLERLRNDTPVTEDVLSTRFAFFRAKIHLECYQRAQARADGVAFMQWLRQEGWRIVICTHRDLRTAYPATKEWLEHNHIPFDHIFRAGNKIVFCRLWGIDILVDDNLFNILYGARYGVRVFYPQTASPAVPTTAPFTTTSRATSASAARGFETFDQLRPWISE